MNNLRNAKQHVWILAMAGVILSTTAPRMYAAEVLHVRWAELGLIIGHTVRISLADGVVTGQAVSVEADALLFNVHKTGDRNAYPKGAMRIPRKNVHRLELQTKGKFFRVALTTAGGLVPFVLGTTWATVESLSGTEFDWYHGTLSKKQVPNHNSAIMLGTIGATAAGIAGGYLAGNALDKHWTVIEITPSPAPGSDITPKSDDMPDVLLRRALTLK